MKPSVPVYRPSLRRRDFQSVLEYLFQDQQASGLPRRQLVAELRKLHRMGGGVALRSQRLAFAYALEDLALEGGAAVGMSALAPAWYYDEVLASGGKPVVFDTEASIPCPSYEDARCAALIVDAAYGHLQETTDLDLPFIVDATMLIAAALPRSLGKKLHAMLVSLEDGAPLSAGGGGVLLCKKKLSKSCPAQHELSDMLAVLALTQLSQLEHFDRDCREIAEQWKELLQDDHHNVFRSNGRCFVVSCEGGYGSALRHARRLGVTVVPAFSEVAAERAFPRIEELKERVPHAHKHLSTLLRIPLYTQLRKDERKRIRSFLVSLN